jgi:exodeoxyribonuclease-3
MKLLSWNINGLRAVLKKDFSAWLQKTKPDVLGLQETKIGDELAAKLDLESFPDYLFIPHGAKRPGYSGTALLIKKSLLPEDFSIPDSVRHGFGEARFDDEGRVQTFDLSILKNGPHAYFVNIYFPNANGELSRLGYKLDFNRALLAYLKQLEKKQPVIVVGDYNVAHEEIDLARPAENEGSAGFTEAERNWFTEFLRAGFVDSFRFLHPDKIQYSWWSFRAGARRRNVGWRIDYVCCSKVLEKKIKKAYILDEVQGSDHAPVGVEL